MRQGLTNYISCTAHDYLNIAGKTSHICGVKAFIPVYKYEASRKEGTIFPFAFSLAVPYPVPVSMCDHSLSRSQSTLDGKCCDSTKYAPPWIYTKLDICLKVGQNGLHHQEHAPNQGAQPSFLTWSAMSYQGYVDTVPRDLIVLQKRGQTFSGTSTLTSYFTIRNSMQCPDAAAANDPT